MKSCGALLVLLCCCLTQLRGEPIREAAVANSSTQPTYQPDVHTVLREMSAVIAEQKVELRYTKTQLETMETRLRASENKAETLETRLRASENKAETLETRLRASEDQLKNILRENAERRVAFSVSLETTAPTNIITGPFNTGTTLIYKQVFTNTGNAYSSRTGFFTAPVKGVYDFSFYTYLDGSSSKMAASLRRNGQQLVSVYAAQSGVINVSNGVSVLLEVGDVVDVYLPANFRIVDNVNHHSTFRGHLLFQAEQTLQSIS